VNKFEQHIDYVFSALPDINTLPGFFLYSLLCYGCVLFLGWLLNPTVDKFIAED
jgi:hypothetical protein